MTLFQQLLSSTIKAIHAWTSVALSEGLSPIDVIDAISAFPRPSSAMSDYPRPSSAMSDYPMLPEDEQWDRNEESSRHTLPVPLAEPSILTLDHPDVEFLTTPIWSIKKECGKRLL